MNAPIIAGVDGTRAALRAAAWAADEAESRGSALQIVNAYGIPGSGYGEKAPPQDWLSAWRAESEAILNEAADVATLQHPKLTIERLSDVDDTISLLLAKSESAAMIVVGSAGRGPLADLVAGSTATTLVARAHCPVVVVRGDGKRGQDAPVVAGVDGSEHDQLVLRVAFEEAALRGAPLVALHTWADADPAHVYTEAMAPFDFEPVREAEARVLAEAVAGWREKYPDVAVEEIVEQHGPREHLLAWSAKARLVVVGSRGRGGFTGLLLGSTSQALIQHAACPVIVARGEGKAR